ncbi:MAG: hypothetical protein OXH90_03600 [Paracoccaceae bacterium]|nr:hypothetical protein [Paracoccaceae bacterium]MDE2916915.1 hypothetical protein [Paracoccaceae bacterium]
MPETDKLIDLDRRFAVLEECMNTITESYDRGWKHLEAKIGEDNAKRDAEFSKLREDNARFREDMAKRDTEMAKRDTANTRWLIAVITAATAIIIAVMAVLLSTS